MRTRSRRGFTMTELLVVISIIVLMIAMAVPALSGLMGSSERSLAENQLKAALAAARDAAIQSETGDAAAVFLFNATNGVERITVVPCIVVAQLDDVDDNTAPQTAATVHRPRDVLVPIPNIAPTQLPRGWSVRAYAAPGTMFDPAPNGQAEQWYETYMNAGGQPAARKGHWLFPETAFYDPTKPKAGTLRQSFMVRFKVGTGALDTSSGGTALAFDPVQDSSFRSAAPYSKFRADQLIIEGKIAPNAAAWVRRILDRSDYNDPTNPANVANMQLVRYVVGDASLDTVMVRPVTELALFKEVTMAASIGASGLNAATGTIYGDPSPLPGGAGRLPTWPQIDTSLFAGGLTADDVNDRVTQWIEGRYHLNGQVGSALVASDARVFTVEHYLGQAQELVP